jgi:hypothetical protein
MQTLEWLLALIHETYQRNAVLVAAVSAVIILPVIALISFVVQSGARRRARLAAERLAERRAADLTPGAEQETGLTMPVRRSQAWLTVEGAGASPLPLAAHMIRIGRHEDNDIRLADSSVHRYHALIQRTPEEDFVITDLSGKDGNGVRINGTRHDKARLSDGDLIELGRAKLKFEHVPI